METRHHRDIPQARFAAICSSIRASYRPPGKRRREIRPTAQPAKLTSSAAANPQPNPMTAPHWPVCRSALSISRQGSVAHNLKAGRRRSPATKRPRKEMPAPARLRILSSSISHPVGSARRKCATWITGERDSCCCRATWNLTRGRNEAVTIPTITGFRKGLRSCYARARAHDANCD